MELDTLIFVLNVAVPIFSGMRMEQWSVWIVGSFLTHS